MLVFAPMRRTSFRTSSSKPFISSISSLPTDRTSDGPLLKLQNLALETQDFKQGDVVIKTLIED